MAEDNEIIPIEENRLYCLFRRGQKKHIEALYNDGEVYINAIDFIRTCDNNAERSDKEDGILSRKFFGNGTVTICDVGKNLDKDGISMEPFNAVLNTDHKDKGNIYCMTGIYSEYLSGDRSDIILDTKSFGESIIFIHRPKIFLDRLIEALAKLGYNGVKHNRIQYYENDYSGGIGFFKKHERFKHQSEYRIFIPNTKEETIQLKIGPLHDIAVINPGLVKLTYTDKKEQFIRL